MKPSSFIQYRAPPPDSNRPSVIGKRLQSAYRLPMTDDCLPDDCLLIPDYGGMVQTKPTPTTQGE